MSLSCFVDGTCFIFFSSDTHVPFLIPRQNQGRTQHQETENDLTKSIKVVLSNLLEAKSLPKRKLDDTDDNTVRLFPPKKRKKWYRGKSGKDSLYVRKCVLDVVSLFSTELEKSDSFLWVISGEAGIGKSWSINLFLVELLRLKKKIFFHSGSYGAAWKIQDGSVREADPLSIEVLEGDWIYIYDSPGAKAGLTMKERAVPRSGEGVSLIFSSPKAENYAYATSKGGSLPQFFHLPPWEREEMLAVKKGNETDVAASETENAVNACYDIWGGNMRALDGFLKKYKKDPEKAVEEAKEGIAFQISLISKDFAEKMTDKLQKQDIQGTFNAVQAQNSPGHILVPVPSETDIEKSGCFEKFRWRFCSQMAELKFWEHAKNVGHDLVKKLLMSVFETPSARGVLFEKVAHILISNGAIEKFKCYPYNDRQRKSEKKFEKCNEVVPLETGKLQAELKSAFNKLLGGTGAIALEPKDASFDAVDMFVLEKNKTGGTFEDWSLYLIQDTISKTHSFHPVKVLWYCSIFFDVFRDLFPEDKLATDANLLQRCKYAPVVPRAGKEFSFKAPTSSLSWNELERVGKILDFEWPEEIEQPSNYKDFVEKRALDIPITASGKSRKLTKSVVANALICESAANKVEDHCEVIYDVVHTWQQQEQG